MTPVNLENLMLLWRQHLGFCLYLSTCFTGPEHLRFAMKYTKNFLEIENPEPSMSCEQKRNELSSTNQRKRKLENF